MGFEGKVPLFPCPSSGNPVSGEKGLAQEQENRPVHSVLSSVWLEGTRGVEPGLSFVLLH